MLTVVEFRITEEEAARHLPPDVGRRLGDSVRVVTTPEGSDIYALIGSIERQRRGDDPFYVSFKIERRYRPAELAAAALFYWKPTSYFEPTGEECGTDYDESTTCRYCRVGRTQRSVLVLDLTRIPRRDVAVSLAGEIVVSDRFREVFEAHGFTGAIFGPVRHHRRTRGRSLPTVHQLILTAARPDVAAPPTRFGIGPFDADTDGEYRCPLGHVAGLNLLSEVTVDVPTPPASDLTATAQAIGLPIGTGLIRPEPLLLVSPRLYDMIELGKMTRGRFVVAHVAVAPGTEGQRS